MGHHKYNPTAIAAKEGKLPPKLPKKSKKEQERELSGMILGALAAESPFVLYALQNYKYKW